MTDWTGVLSLDLEERRGKTVAKNVYFQGALKVMRPIYHDNSGQVCYYLLNPGGGYLDGDRYKMEISANEGAKVTLTTQSATKVYKTPKSFAYQETTISLKRGSYLEYLPDPLIAYENARYKQKNVIHMESGATFLYTDILTPGWSPSGTRFSYDTVQLVTEIHLDGKLGMFDHIKLTPHNQNLSGLGFMEGYTHLGSMAAVSENTDNALLDELYETIQIEEADFKVGISRLAVPGFSIRILANSTQLIERIFNSCHKIISEKWTNHTPNSLRKY
ncbi:MULTISPECIES: urease accessory protein UreD [unclassified Viridibacillus]|uniref:urease accessory protein UreD n=1 Tax=unclassified Viridibacillus TaxID=2617942 RepID=UPI00096D8763|nr:MULTISPECIES: urease accessory protein UreD [unclassified Viridibacillus]OMC81996.1 urease accessory protein [Viridibacillus sp. FSL H8-0123]OMC86154.1 urease accessory protein [Viridibacillus sp. FSL H7-0596]